MQLRYDFPDAQNAKTTRLMELGEMWKAYKHDLYKGWKCRQGTDMEGVPVIPDCPLSQYKELIAHWKSDNFMVYLLNLYLN